MKESRSCPPRLAKAMLRKLACWVEREALIDDLEEEYSSCLSKNGKSRTRLWYWLQIFRAIPSLVHYSFYRNVIMSKNYALIALRNIRRHKIFSSINILGLAIGMSLCLLVINTIYSFYSADSFHEKKERIFRIISESQRENTAVELATAPLPLLYEMEQIPEIETIVRLKKNFRGPAVFEDKILMIDGYFVDDRFFQVFSFELEKGDPRTSLSKPYSMVLTRATALKFFGNHDPVGQILSIKNVGEFQITGVLKDTSDFRSHMKFECLVSVSTLSALEMQKKIDASLSNWENLNDNYIYLLLREGASPEKVAGFFPDITAKHYGENEEKYQFHLQSLTKISPGKNLGNFLSTPAVNPSEPLLLSSIAFIIMLIACFNYTNLSLARALSRAKEVGIRKVIGASRFKLISQFIGEAVTYALLALLFAVVFLKYFLVGLFSNMPFYTQLRDPNIYLIVLFVIFAVTIGILAGMIPALIISKFRPVLVLKDIGKARIFSGINLRRSMVIIQFFFSCVFIMLTLVMFRQIRFVKTLDPGFESDNIFNVELQGIDYNLFKQEILNHPDISKVSASNLVLCTGTRARIRTRHALTNEKILVDMMSVDEDFLGNFELELLAGRNFPQNDSGQQERHVLINNPAVTHLGFKTASDALGSYLQFGEDTKLEIIGIVKEFYSQNTSIAIQPMIMRKAPKYFGYANIKIPAGDKQSALQFLEEKWKELSPYCPFTYGFLEDQMAAYHVDVDQMLQGVSLVTFLAILIAFFGLLGMVIYDTEMKVKEIGIRKVLGASFMDIILVTSKSFVALLLIASVPAIPVAWYLSHVFLRSSVNRIPLGVGIFAQGFLILMILGLAVIFSQTFRRALGNPVDSLRYE